MCDGRSVQCEGASDGVLMPLRRTQESRRTPRGMSTPISPQKTAAREGSRQNDGKFGIQQHGESSVSLGSTLPAVQRSTRDAAEDFVAAMAPSGADHEWNLGTDASRSAHMVDSAEDRAAHQVCLEVQNLLETVDESELDDALLELTDQVFDETEEHRTLASSAARGQAAALRSLVKTGSTTTYTDQVASLRSTVTSAAVGSPQRRQAALDAMNAELNTGRTRYPHRDEFDIIHRAMEDPTVVDDAIDQALKQSKDQKDAFGSAMMRGLRKHGEAMV